MIAVLRCGCGCSTPDDVRESVEHVYGLVLRGFGDLGMVEVKSGYRCAARNKAVGGAKNSMHVLGRAIDFKVALPGGEYVAASALALHAEAMIGSGVLPQGGVGTYGRYPGLLHYDDRGSKARWWHENA